MLTIFESANNTIITVRATSLSNSSIYDTKELVLTYKRSAVTERLIKSLGNLSNVDSTADQRATNPVIMVKKANTTEWVMESAPPAIVTDKTEDQVLAMIENGTIDDNTLYFCQE